MKESLAVIRCRAALALRDLYAHSSTGTHHTHWRFTLKGMGPRKNRTVLFNSATVNALIDSGEAIRRGDVVRSLVKHRREREGT